MMKPSMPSSNDSPARTRDKIETTDTGNMKDSKDIPAGCADIMDSDAQIIKSGTEIFDSGEDSFNSSKGAIGDDLELLNSHENLIGRGSDILDSHEDLIGGGAVSSASSESRPQAAGSPGNLSGNTASLARRVALTSLLAALALIFSYVEALVPFNAGVPGIKLGLANLVPLIILYRLDARYAFGANLIRVILAGLLFSGLFAALYSLAGSLTSFLVMWLLKKTDRFSIIGVSMAGGVFHNLGQLTVAMLAVSGLQLIHYMPVLIISGMIAGIIVGIGAYVLLDRIPAKLFLQ